MNCIDDLKALAERKQKADSLPAEQREQHQDAYNKLCESMQYHMACVIVEMLAKDKPQTDNIQSDIVQGIMLCDAGLFLGSMNALLDGFQDHYGWHPWVNQ